MALVQYACSSCKATLQSDLQYAGMTGQCPACAAPSVVPMAQQSGDSVPFEVGLKNYGQFKTVVSREDAGRATHTLVGAFITLLVVVVCSVLGIRWSGRT